MAKKSLHLLILVTLILRDLIIRQIVTTILPTTLDEPSLAAVDLRPDLSIHRTLLNSHRSLAEVLMRIKCPQTVRLGGILNKIGHLFEVVVMDTLIKVMVATQAVFRSHSTVLRMGWDTPDHQS